MEKAWGAGGSAESGWGWQASPRWRSRRRRPVLPRLANPLPCRLLRMQVAPEEIVPASYTAAAYLAGVLAGSSSTSGSLESSSTESSSSMHASSSGSSLEGSMDGQPGGRRVFMLGTSGLGDELATAGLDYVTWEGLVSSDSGGSSSDGGGGGGGGSSGAAAMHEQWSSATFGELQLDASIGAVLVGWVRGHAGC